MYSKYLLLAIFSAFIVGCSSSYKSIQTPDDVYFSTEKPATDNYVKARKTNDRYYTADEYYEDRMLRMVVRDRNRWSEVDDWYYYNNRYSNYDNRYSNYSYSRNLNSPWNSYNYWNYAYNPYCPSNIIVNTKSTATVNRPRMFNFNSFTNESEVKNSNSKVTGINTNNWYYNSNANNNNNSLPSYQKSSNRNEGTFLRDVFNNLSNTNSRSNSTINNNSGSSNNSSSGSSSGSSGTTAPVRKFDN